MSRKDLFNDIWKAADIMRRDDGTNGINEYIEQISWMFFLKVFEDLEKRFEAEHKLKSKKYSRIIPEKYSWSQWTTKDAKQIINFIDDELFPFLGKLSGSPEKDTIGTIFSEVQRNKMKSPFNLKDVIDIINEINFNNDEDSHVLSIFYEDLLVKLGKESGIAGEFYTPRPIVRLLVRMIDPKLNPKNKENTRILDPFCGSCGFIVESFKHILSKGKITVRDLEILQRSVFHGYEKKSLPYLVGLMNCILHGLITPSVVRRNSLNDNVMKFGSEDKFDFVLTNPPFGGKEGKQIQQNFPVKIQATELLALQQVMRRLKINGICGMVVPEGLVHGGEAFAKVKKDLLENYNVNALISLPSGVFANVTASGQGPKTYLLVFEKTEPTKKIWYYELHPPGGKRYTKINAITDEDLDDCFQKWQKKEISENSWIVDVEEIVKLGYDMVIRPKKKREVIEYTHPKKLFMSLTHINKQINEDLEWIEKSISKIK